MVAESQFRLELKKSYEKHYGSRRCYAISIPSMYIPGGLPDLILCLDGKFVSIECKLITALPKRKDTNMLHYGFTKLQANRAQAIVAAGGEAFGAICIRPMKAFLKVPAEYMREDYNFTEASLDLTWCKFWDAKEQVWRV